MKCLNCEKPIHKDWKCCPFCMTKLPDFADQSIKKEKCAEGSVTETYSTGTVSIAAKHGEASVEETEVTSATITPDDDEASVEETEVASASTTPEEYPRELRQALSGNLDISEMSDLEMQMFEAFQNPDPQRSWREGTLKLSFNYLLLDPRITKNLPNRVCNMCPLDVFQTFIEATFYIGKGQRTRPYFHLYEAIKHQNNVAKKAKVQRILDIWSGGEGVVPLHCFQSVIPVEAYTREACMVDAIGLEHLTNEKRGAYYGVSVTYSAPRKRTMGVYLLKKALQIFLAEGERQISPADIKKP